MKESRIEVISGDITKMSFDAIVNSANKSLLSGGGVDGAIHRAAGPELEGECKEIGGCPTGEARITKSYGLNVNKVNWIIHAVGPRWFDGKQNEDKLLEAAYINTLEISISYKEFYPRQCVDILMKYIANEEKSIQEKLIKEVREEAEWYTKEHPIRTIAFTSISTGVYHFPAERAAEIAVGTIKRFLEVHMEVEKAVLVCFDKRVFECYNNAINKLI